jgi:hypothetical protein
MLELRPGLCLVVVNLTFKKIKGDSHRVLCGYLTVERVG